MFDSYSVINVVAVSSEDYKIWVNGLQLLLEIGTEQAVQVISTSTIIIHAVTKYHVITTECFIL